jgi:hypothetical protein
MAKNMFRFVPGGTIFYLLIMAALPAGILFIFSCDFPQRMGKEESSLTVVLPGGNKNGPARSVLSNDFVVTLRYQITLTGPGGTIDRTAEGGSVTVSLQAGEWALTVQAYDGNDLVGTGSETTTVVPGQPASVIVKMNMDPGYEAALTDIYIHNEAELRQYIADYDGAGITFHLENDISVSGSPVGDLLGTLDGHGYTIDLNISDDDQRAGLFEYNFGTVKNLKLTGIVTGTYGWSWTVFAGAVAGDNYNGLIKNVVSTVKVSAEQTGNGILYAGGIAGTNSGTIEDCSAGGDVQGDKSGSGYNAPESGGIAGENESSGIVNRCYSYGNVSSTNGTGSVGGIVGFNKGAINNCAALNSKVYNSSTVTNFQSRIAGYNSGGTFTNNYAYVDTQIGDPSLSSYITGISTDKNGEPIAATTLLSSGSDVTLWTDTTKMNWSSFQTGSSATEPAGSPWYWSNTIAIPGNDVNSTGVPAAYVPALWFE